jgi:hypothetical protein
MDDDVITVRAAIDMRRDRPAAAPGDRPRDSSA